MKIKKIRYIVETRKIEIWRFLKGIKSISKCIAFGMLWLSSIVFIPLIWVMRTNAQDLMNVFNMDVLYIEVLGRMILIPFVFCFIFCVISIFSKIGMHLIEKKMDDDEMIKAGIICVHYFIKNGEVVVRSKNEKEA